MKTFIKLVKRYIILMPCILISACNYLDIVPENTATIEHAFANRSETENFLAGIYSFSPWLGSTGQNPALTAGDEIWFDDMSYVYGVPTTMWQIAKGNQRTQSPIGNYFSSIQESTIEGNENYNYGGATALFTALSDCNIFLENLDRPYDLPAGEKKQWAAEVKFLKAYYHFWLMRMYGPIPVIRENIEVSEGTATVKRQREPIDNVVAYIVELLDEAYTDLPEFLDYPAIDAGRPTKVIAHALKAQVLTYAASPLFNGNPISIFANYTNADGVKLFPEKDDSKWTKAAGALRIAIDDAHNAQPQAHRLYDFRTMSGETFVDNLHEETILDMQVRGAATHPWNLEIIWGEPRGTYDLERACIPAMSGTQSDGGGTFVRNYAPPLKIVEQFYTKNGIPIEDDEDWVNIPPSSFYETRIIKEEEKYRFHYGTYGDGSPTYSAKVNFDREARFYGSITFDQGTFYGLTVSGYSSDDAMHFVVWDIALKRKAVERYSITGYLVKKLVNYQKTMDMGNQNGLSILPYYPFPIIRLADLYLMYAEALNEATAGGDEASPNPEAYVWIDKVRERTGLKGVKESWTTHAIASKKNKPNTKGGLREIIQRERLNELAFEGARFWDLRRWLLAKDYIDNQPVRGLNSAADAYADFYSVRTYGTQKFEDKDYFWPIKLETVLRNPLLKQSPGWESYTY